MTAQAHGPHHASARSAARLVAAPLVALVLMLVSGTAYAEVDWHEKGANMSATVSPWSYPEGRPYALAEFLGYDWGSLSTDVRDKILTDSNGDNAFKALLDHSVLNVQYETGDGALDWPIIGIWSTIFGLDKCWDISTTNDRYADARAVMEKYMFPREGGTEVPPEQPNIGATSIVMPVAAGSGYDLGQNTCRKTGSASGTVTYNLTAGAVNALRALGCQYIYGVVMQGIGKNDWSGYTSGQFFAVYGSASQVVQTNSTGSKSTNWGSIEYYNLNLSSDSNIFYAGWYPGGSYISNNIYNGTINGSYSVSTQSYSNVGTSYTISGLFNNNSLANAYYATNAGQAVVVEPYEPTPVVNPTRPELQIGDVTVDLSSGPYTVNNTTYSVVYAPDNSWSINVETHTDTPYSGDVTPTDATDYTSILNAILTAINDFRREFNTAYNDIDADLTTLTNSLNNSIKNVETTLKNQLQAMQTQQHNDIQTLQTNLQNTITGRWDTFAEDLWKNLAAMDGDIIDELYKDAKYIVDNLNFNADFDDSDIVSWLKRIYGRVRDRKITIPSPDEDTDGWVSAIEEFLAKILSMMVTGLDVAQIASLFDQLKNRFPISIPWDMMAILYLFDGEPVTPVFDWPIYNGDVMVTQLHCDFSDYDDVMTYVRQGELLLFAIGLMYHTKWLMNVETEVIDHRKG